LKAVIQRVTEASVSVGDETVGRIGPGLVVLLGVAQGDTATDACRLAEKTAGLRIFSDAEGRFNLSLLDTGGEALVVSQFTLLADSRKGRRPSFTGAAPPEEAKPLVGEYENALRRLLRRAHAGGDPQRRPRHDHPRQRRVRAPTKRIDAPFRLSVY